MQGDAISKFFDIAASPENPFSILETLEEASRDILPFTPFDEPVFTPTAGVDDDLPAFYNTKVLPLEIEDDDEDASVSRKKVKLVAEDGQIINKVSHITVERNRRKQMNENLTVLRSLMPCFYVKRGDQASIIGGVVDYIKELQQVLQSLQAKKQRKVYSEMLSPRPASSSPRPPPLSPRPLPKSPRSLGLPISPRTPQPGSPYKPRNVINIQQAAALSHESISPTTSLENAVDMPPAAVINSKSPVADVEVKFSGANVILKTVSQRIPGQAVKIIGALEGHSLEIVHVSINTVDDAMLNSFTVKIGIECELSAEELAQEIQQTFS